MYLFWSKFWPSNWRFKWIDSNLAMLFEQHYGAEFDFSISSCMCLWGFLKFCSMHFMHEIPNQCQNFIFSKKFMYLAVMLIDPYFKSLFFLFLVLELHLNSAELSNVSHNTKSKCFFLESEYVFSFPDLFICLCVTHCWFKLILELT